MKNSIKFPGILGLLLFGACAEIPESPGNTTAYNLLDLTNQCSRTPDDALEIAEKWLADIDPATRGSRRSVSSIDVLTCQNNTRSAESDTLMYLINYENEEGFALVGGSEYSKEIYAISPEGRLLMSDTTYNVGLKIFMEAALADAAIVNPPIVGTEYVYGIKRRGGSALPNNVAKWSQNAPYNQFCPKNKYGAHGVVGCGPVAVGMLLAHYEWPKMIDNTPIDWTDIKENNNTTKAAEVLELIAGENYLFAFYTDSIAKDTRATYSDMYIPTFKKLNFDISECWDEYQFHSNRTVIFDFLKDGIVGSLDKAPLLMNGSRINSEGKRMGHVWIIDGFIECVKYPKLFPENKSESDPLLRMVWGWGGTANGYYTYLLDTSKLDTVSSDGTGTTYPYTSLKVYGRLRVK